MQGLHTDIIALVAVQLVASIARQLVVAVVVDALSVLKGGEQGLALIYACVQSARREAL